MKTVRRRRRLASRAVTSGSPLRAVHGAAPSMAAAGAFVERRLAAARNA